MQVESSELHSAEQLSCRSFFVELPVKKKINQLVVYVHFYLEDSRCLDAPINFPLCTANNNSTNAGGIAHLLLVTHRFPAAKTVCYIVLSMTYVFLVFPWQGIFLNSFQMLLQYEVECDAFHSTSLFAEALLLPYDAIFLDEDSHNHPSGDSLQKLGGEPACVSQINMPELSCCRKPKFDELSRDSPNSKFCLKPAEGRPFFPCLLTFARSSLQKPQCPGYLCHKRSSVLENKSVGLHPVLLEFLSDSFIKYQVH